MQTESFRMCKQRTRITFEEKKSWNLLSLAVVFVRSANGRGAEKTTFPTCTTTASASSIINFDSSLNNNRVAPSTIVADWRFASLPSVSNWIKARHQEYNCSALEMMRIKVKCARSGWRISLPSSFLSVTLYGSLFTPLRIPAQLFTRISPYWEGKKRREGSV